MVEPQETLQWDVFETHCGHCILFYRVTGTWIFLNLNDLESAKVFDFMSDHDCDCLRSFETFRKWAANRYCLEYLVRPGPDKRGWHLISSLSAVC